MDRSEQDQIIWKVLLNGDSRVGKSELKTRFMGYDIRERNFGTFKIDPNIIPRSVQVDGKIIMTQIWDPTRWDSIRSMPPSYFRMAVGVFLVYDITKRLTYENVDNRLKELRDQADDNIVIMLVGNKSDLQHLREVPTDEAKAFAEKNSLYFIETSALDATNVETAFQNMLTEINKRVSDGENSLSKNVQRRSMAPRVKTTESSWCNV